MAGVRVRRRVRPPPAGARLTGKRVQGGLDGSLQAGAKKQGDEDGIPDEDYLTRLVKGIPDADSIEIIPPKVQALNDAIGAIESHLKVHFAMRRKGYTGLENHGAEALDPEKRQMLKQHLQKQLKGEAIVRSKQTNYGGNSHHPRGLEARLLNLLADIDGIDRPHEDTPSPVRPQKAFPKLTARELEARQRAIGAAYDKNRERYRQTVEEKNQEIRERERAQREQERLAEAEKAEAANQEEGEVRPRSTASRVREAMRAADKAEASMIAITHMTHHFHSLRKASVMHTGPLDLPDGEEDGAGPGEERGADVQAEDGGDASSEASEKEQAAAANVVEERPRTPPKVMMPARYRAQKKAEEKEDSETVVEDSFATFLQRIETAFNDCRLQTVQEEFDDAPMARILQARLERIWRLLEMPVMDRLDMVTKYTDREASVVMVQALDCWEHCTGICLSHERLIELMQDMPRKGTEEQITNLNKLLSDSTHRVVDGLATLKRLFADTLTTRGEKYEPSTFSIDELLDALTDEEEEEEEEEE